MSSDSHVIKELVREKTQLETLIPELAGAPVTKDSGDEWRMQCPWCKDDGRDDLTVSTSKQLWHCWACGRGGDCYSFVMLWESLTFPEALRTLADRVGVAVADVSPEERAQAMERHHVEGVYLAAARYYHEQLPSEVRDAWYRQRYGFTDKTVDELWLGYAPPGDEVVRYLHQLGFNAEDLAKTGLFWANDSQLQPVFQGRLVFPYWYRGKVVYMAGRQTEQTRGLCPEAKYVKLLTRSESHHYVSPTVSNGYFIGEDWVRGAAVAYITEGIPDCIAGHQHGLAICSPGTIRFRREDEERLVRLLRGVQRVYIVNDAEESGAGEAGALATAQVLDQAGHMDVRLIQLPRGEAQKVDLCDFLRDHGRAAFDELSEAAPRLLDYRLQQVPSETPHTELLDLLPPVLTKLAGPEPAVVEAYLGAIRERFGLTDEEMMAYRSMITNSCAATSTSRGLGVECRSPQESSVRRETGVVDVRKGGSQADLIIRTALDKGLTLFRDNCGRAMAAMRVNEHREIWPCRSWAFRSWLAGLVWRRHGKTTNAEALSSALSVFEAEAAFGGDEAPLHNRVAWLDGAIWYDMSRHDWRLVRVTPEGWDLAADAPLLFRRYAHQRPQVEPVRGGDINEVIRFANLSDRRQEVLLLVYLVSCLVPNIPHPIPVLYGPQGAAKTTVFRMLRRLVDPSAVETITFPSSHSGLVQQLSHHWMPLYDSITTMPDWISDALCRAVTGEGFSKRELYSDDEDVIYEFRRCVGVNGTNVAAHKPDLLDRCLLLALEPITPTARRPEQELWTEFEAVRPAILGGMFDALSRAMALRDTVQAARLPRMADFALWGCAIAQALGHSREDFLQAFERDIDARHAEVIASDPVAEALVAFMEDKPRWEGTASELLAELGPVAHLAGIGTHTRAWPKAPQSLSRRLNVLQTTLGAAGLHITTNRDAHRRRLLIRKETEHIVTSDTSVTRAAGQHGDIGVGDAVWLQQPLQQDPFAADTARVRHDDDDGSDADDASLIAFPGEGGHKPVRETRPRIEDACAQVSDDWDEL